MQSKHLPKKGSIVTFKTQGSLHFGLRRKHLAFNSISHEVVRGATGFSAYIWNFKIRKQII